MLFKLKSVIFFLSVASTATNFVLERQLGLIERSYLAGLLLFSKKIRLKVKIYLFFKLNQVSKL